MHIFWPNLIVGLVMVAGGVLVLIYRGPITRASVKGQTSVFGRTVGQVSERRTSPRWTGVAGAVITAGGLLSIAFAFLRH